MNRKVFAGVVLIGVVVFIGIIIYVSRWKTYVNNTYWFTFKYPANWELVDEPDSNSVSVHSPGFKINDNNPDLYYKSQYLVFNYFANKLKPDTEEKPITKTFGTRVGNLYEKDRSIYFPLSNGVGAYVVYSPMNDDQSNKILSTFRFIEPGSEANISAWQTYSNSQYGLELKYPNGWSLSVGTSEISIISSQSCLKMHLGDIWPKDCFSFNLLIQKNKILTQTIPTKMKIAGFPSEKFEVNDGEWILNQSYFQFEKDGNWYISSLSFNPENKIGAENLLKQILATFKFTK